MDTNCFIVIYGICLSLFLKYIISLFINSTTTTTTKISGKLPPGPVVRNLLWIPKSSAELEVILRKLIPKYGPIIALKFGFRTNIFVSSHSLAHQALVQNGAVFSNRPPILPITKTVTSNQHNMTNAPYGPIWRLLRRNFTVKFLHPSQVKSFSHARKWTLKTLISRLICQAKSGQGVVVVRDHFKFAMLHLVAFMCFGVTLNEHEIVEIESAQHRAMLSYWKFDFLNMFPKTGKLLFPHKWKYFLGVRESQEKALFPLIRARLKAKEEMQREARSCCYADTLLNLELPDGDEKRKLNEGEVMTLCSEFLNAATFNTATALEWIMANVVKYPLVQSKLFEEIRGVVLSNEEIREEDLQEMPYLKAVVLEGLRRHPPTHFVLPRGLTQDTALGDYVLPKNGTVTFMAAEMGWDPRIWENPMEFKPDRFMGEGEGFDLTGSREVKMMPFSVGRRMCPGWSLAMLHLEYFVANLVWFFEWAIDGDNVDLSEKHEFITVMKKPLQARIIPRFNVEEICA